MPIQTRQPVTSYFEMAQSGVLPPDIADYIKWLTFEDFDAPLYSPGEDYGLWNILPQRHSEYAIAFAAYGFANVALIDPTMRAFAIHALDFAILKMRHETVWGDWKADGLGDDPIIKNDIMYKGHVRLMYGLFQLISGDTRHEKE